jgi:hypothetical protein
MAGEIDLKVSADIGDLRRQLESIPGITAEQARLMVAELDRGYKRAEKAAASAAKATRASMKQAEEATKRAAEAGKELGDRFGHVGSGAGKLAGALDMLLPGLGSVGQGVADLADVGEVAAGALGGAAAPALAVVATAAAGAAIYMTALTNEMAREAESARIAGTANAYVAEQLQIQRVAALDLAVATGQLSEAARAEADIRMQAGTSLERYLNTLEDTSKASLETENRNVAIAETLGMIGTAAVAPVAAFVALANAMGANIPTVTDLTKKLGEYMGFIGVYPKTQQDVARATEAATAATKKARDGQLQLTKAKRQHVAATRELVPLIKEEKVATDALNAATGTIESARQAELTQSQKLRETLAGLLTERNALAESGKLTAEQEAKYATASEELAKMVADARIEEEIRAVTAIEQYEAESNQRREDAAAEDLAKKIARAQEFASVTNEIAETAAMVSEEYLRRETQDLEDAMAAREGMGKDATKAEKKAADERIQRERKQAQIAFAIDQALKVAQAVTAAALATINALATPPAPNYLAAGLAAAQGAVAVATVSSTRPSFHSGGMADFAPDEASAIVRRGEAVLSPAGRAAIGDDTIRAANAGMGSGQTIVVQQVYRHRVFDSFVTDNLRTRGPLSRALGAGARAGQRRS